MNKSDNLKLVYVHKVGENSRGMGIYEFLFTENTEELLENVDTWIWDKKPASDPEYAQVPEEEYIDKVLELKTDKFKLNCLHESDHHSYMDGVQTIHCLAYEEENLDEFDFDFEDMEEYEDEDMPILVFHFGMTEQQVKDMFYERDIILEEEKVKI